MLFSILMYIGLGVIAGLLAGLLGIGGGMVVVPILFFTLTQAGIQHEVMHLAIGTSFCTIIFTSLSNALALHRRGAVLWPLARALSPGLVMGVIVGSCFASELKSAYLQVFFTGFLVYAALNMARGNARPDGRRPLPGTAGLLAVSGVIGFLASLVGIAGAAMTIPFLCWCSVPIRQAMGTAATLGLPVALTGAITYMYTGWNVVGLPEYSLGYIYLPAGLGISAASMLVTPLGAALAHRLPVGVLKKIFAVFLLALAARMTWQVLSPYLAS
jgi:uncharacterized membrane protein YfcA